MSALLGGALEAAMLFGWPVFPLRELGKIPQIKGWQKKATTDVEVIRKWWRRFPNANIGVPTGAWSFVVLDADSDAARAFVEARGIGPPNVRTRRGWQWYLRPPEHRVRNSAGKIAPMLDVRGDGGLVAIPPSRREGGFVYSFEDDAIRPWPDWLSVYTRPIPEPPRVQRSIRIEHVSGAFARKVLERARTKIVDAAPGTRNNTLNAVSYSVGRLVGGGRVGMTDAVTALVCAARDASYKKEAVDRISIAVRDGMRKPRVPDDRRR